MFFDANAQVINQKTKTIKEAKDNTSLRTRTKEIDVIKKIKNPMVESATITNQETFRYHPKEKKISVDISICGETHHRMGRKFADVIRESGQINILFNDITIDNGNKAK